MAPRNSRSKSKGEKKKKEEKGINFFSLQFIPNSFSNYHLI